MFGHVERIKDNRIAKRVCAGSSSIGRLPKRWIDTMKDALRAEVFRYNHGEMKWAGRERQKKGCIFKEDNFRLCGLKQVKT